MTIAEKVATLTANVHPDFKYSSMGANTDNLTALQNAMTNRLTDYDITGYTLTVLSTKYVDANTIEMLCNLNVSGTKKTTQAQVSKSFSNEKITWVYNTTNNLNRWQIYRGLPYNFELQ